MTIMSIISANNVKIIKVKENNKMAKNNNKKGGKHQCESGEKAK